MKLTKDNITVYASKYYDNPYCITEEEFKEDLERTVTIKRSVTKFMKKGNVNIRLLVNNIITFYNVFEHHAASEILSFKLEETQYKHVNAILKFASLPLINGGEVSQETTEILYKEFSDAT